MQSLGITATPTFAGLTLTGFTISGGLITKYGNVVPVLGSILKGNGSAFVAGEPIENQNAILQPVGICPPINQTDVRAVGADTTYCIYVGRIPSAITTIDVMYKVTTAGITIAYAEVAIFKGAVAFGAGTSLSRVGFTDVSAVVNSTGVKKTTVSLSGVVVGDDLWLAFSSSATTEVVLRGCPADELQQGGFQSVAGRASTQSIPVTVARLSGTSLLPWMTAKW